MVSALVVELLTSFRVDANVTEKTTIKDSIPVLSIGRFDLAILDFEVPDGYGTELVETIRRFHPDCKIIVYSGLMYDQDTAERIVKRYKPDGIIGKPINNRIFAELLEKCGIK